jgi:hypothetical protein
MIIDVAFWVVHDKVTGPPEAGENSGFAVNEVI